MSSAPVGLDSREYSYGFALLSDATSLSFDLNGALITRIQCFAGTVPIALRLVGKEIPVVAGACVSLEPNGALRSSVVIAGGPGVGTGMCIVEYWYPTQADGIEI